MKYICQDCNKEYPRRTAHCKSCGGSPVPLSYAEISVTPADISSCSLKEIPFAGMEQPVCIRLIPSLKNGQDIIIRKARFIDSGEYIPGEVHVKLTISEESAEVSNAGKKKRRAPFGVHLAAVLSIIPLTVLLTFILFYFTARPVFNAAGFPAVLLLSGIALLLLLLLRLVSPRRYDRPLRNSLIITTALALSLLLRYGPSKIGIDLTRVFSNIGTVFFPSNQIESADSGIDFAVNTPDPVYSTPFPAYQSDIPHIQERYYLCKLTADEIENLTALYRAVLSFKKECRLPRNADEQALNILIQLLRLECPELIMADFSVSYSSTVNAYTGNVRTVQIPYSMSKSEYIEATAACHAVIEKALHDTAEMSDWDKILFVYRLLCEKNSYSVSAPHAGDAYGALVRGQAKCDGISLAAKWLLEEMGVACEIVSGTSGDGAGHAWNAARIGSEFAVFDITNDVSNDRSDYLYPVCGVCPDWIERQYAPDSLFEERFRLPFTSSMAFSYHVLNQSYAASFEDASRILSRHVRALSASGGGSFCIQCETDSVYQALLSSMESSMRDLFSSLSKGGGYSAVTLAEFRTVRIAVYFS